VRLLDLAAAGAVGLSVLIALQFLDPGPMDQAASAAREKGALARGIESAVQSEGLPSIQSGGKEGFCQFLSMASNGTVAFGGEFDGAPCGPTPPLGAVSVGVTLDVGGVPVVVDAWLPGKA
jgi:hypothetical protein